MQYQFPPAPVPTIAISGSERAFPIRRIFCVGRNYAAHAAEMGGSVDREAPWYFTKSAHAYCPPGGVIPYPPGTSDFHHEIELVVAIGKPGFRLDVDSAAGIVFGHTCGLDMTRRDLQAAAKAQRRPWDTGKDVENGAIIAPILPGADLVDPGARRIWLKVNGQIRQEARLSDMVWSVPEIIAHLSGLYHLMPGDLIMTGTPAGVGPVVPGDALTGGIDGLPPLRVSIGPAD